MMKQEQSDETSHSYKELEQEKLFLEEINKDLTEHEQISNEVLDSMSHELRTPIVTIKGYTDMLINGNFGDLTTIQKERLDRIKKNIDLLIEAIFELLKKKEKLKNYLTPVATYADLLSQEILGKLSDPQKEKIELIKKQYKRNHVPHVSSKPQISCRGFCCYR